MPSPVGHTIAGLVIAEVFNLRGHRRYEAVLWANLPDLDMVPGLIMKNRPGAAHGKASHSLGATLFAAIGAAVIAHRRERSALKACGGAAVAYGSHLLLDFLGKESSNDGLQLFWPLSKWQVASDHEWFRTILSRSRERGFWRGLLLWDNVKAVAREVYTLAPCWLIARGLRRQHLSS